MAVTTTPNDILIGAYAKSTKNKPGTLATEATELLQVVIRAMRGLYAAAARVNPYFFAESADVTISGGAWARPETAESVVRLERVAATTGGLGAAGTRIIVVPFDDRAAEPGKPAVYRFGQQYWSAGNSPDPTGGDIKFYYAKRPTDPATVNSTLDAKWTEQFNELLMLEVALYLATKDEGARGNELQSLDRERMKWVELFKGFLEHETADVVHRFGHIQRINTSELVPLLAPAA